MIIYRELSSLEKDLGVSAKALSGKTAEEILASKAARYMKYGMFAAILVFFVSSALTRFIG